MPRSARNDGKASLPVIGGDAGPVVGAEGRGGQAGLVVQVADRVVGPGVADGHRLWAPRGLQTTTVSASILASAQTNFLSAPAMAKPFSRLVALGDQAVAGVVEVERGSCRPRSVMTCRAGRRRPRPSAVDHGHRPHRASRLPTSCLFFGWMSVGVADVDGDGHARVGHGEGLASGPRAARPRSLGSAGLVGS